MSDQPNGSSEWAIPIAFVVALVVTWGAVWLGFVEDGMATLPLFWGVLILVGVGLVWHHAQVKKALKKRDEEWDEVVRSERTMELWLAHEKKREREGSANLEEKEDE